MRGQFALDGRRHHVLPFAGLELILQAAHDPELAAVFQVGDVAGAEEAVLRERLRGSLRVLVVAHHVHRAADQQFAAGVESGFHAG